MKDLKEKVEEILKKAKDIKLDLSKEEDLVIGIMNLISLEEHLFFSGVKTGNDLYYNLLIKIRKIRKELMRKVIKNSEEGAEIWCISKHLLAATMRLYETGEKLLDSKREKEAKELFDYSYELFSIFWGLNLNILNKEDVIKLIDEKEEIREAYKESEKIERDIENLIKSKEKGSKLKEIIKKIIDCCIE
ncbi:MAG: hypothetical protein QXR54_02305 [Nanopusillaceae archaeon]